MYCIVFNAIDIENIVPIEIVFLKNVNKVTDY